MSKHNPPDHKDQKLSSIDVHDVGDMDRSPSMTPIWPKQIYCNCIHDTISNDLLDGESPRNLVVCIDGTANQFGNRNSNVVELYSLLEKKNTVQVTFYNSGIGTYATPSHKDINYYKQVIGHKVDLALALRFEKILLSAYRWLCEQYTPGDRIFLFGFSRGAYQVRALSGMLEKVGLIYKGNEVQIPFAYALYRDCSRLVPVDERHSKNASTKETQNTVKTGHSKDDTTNEFQTKNLVIDRAQDAIDVRSSKAPSTYDVQKVANNPGLDITDAEGLETKPRGQKSKASQDDLRSKISEVPDENRKPRQVQTADEAASVFKRTFCRNVKVHFVGVWDTVSSVGIGREKGLPFTTEGMTHVCFFRHALALNERRVKFLPEFSRGGKGPGREQIQAAPEEMPHTKEVWFVGTHSDIGGGNIDNKELQNNGPALRWMTREATLAGLPLNPSSTRWKYTVKDVNESLKGFWWVLEVLPFKQLTYNPGDETETTRRPHLGKKRKIVEGQLLHISAVNRYEDLMKKREPWEIERDNFDQVTSQILSSLELLSYVKDTTERKNHLFSLRSLFNTFEAQQALMNLSHDLYDQDEPTERTISLMDILIHTAADRFQKQHFSRMPRVIRQMLSLSSSTNEQTRARYEECAKNFLVTFGTAEIFSIRRKGPISAFAFSPSDFERPYIVCGTHSGNIFLRDLKTGAEWGGQMRSNSNAGHSLRVTCIVFNQTGTQFASVSLDNTIRIWDAKTGDQIGTPRLERTGPLRSLVVSRDGKQAVLTSGQNALLVPDLFARVAEGPEPRPPTSLRGSNGDITSITFADITTPGTDYHVAASIDNTILFWSNRELAEMADSKSRHRGAIRSVLFSKDGSRLFAGSDDGTISLWDPSTRTITGMWAATTGDNVTVYSDWLGAEREAITSLALHPNEEDCIVVGLKSGTVRRWNLTSGIPSILHHNHDATDANKADNTNEGVKGEKRLEECSAEEDERSGPRKDKSSAVNGQQTTEGDVAKGGDNITEEKMWSANWRRYSLRSLPSSIMESLYSTKTAVEGSVGSTDEHKAEPERSVTELSPNPVTTQAHRDGTIHTIPKLGAKSHTGDQSTANERPRNQPADMQDKSQTKSKLTRERDDLQYSTSSIVSVAYSPDGTRIAACNEHGLVIVWDAEGPAGPCILEQLKENTLWFPVEDSSHIQSGLVPP